MQQIGYAYSGVPAYYRDGDLLLHGSYVLYQGRRPREERSEPEAIGLLSPEAWVRIDSAPIGLEAHTVQQEAIDAGLLVEIIDATGTPQWVIPGAMTA